MKSKIIELLMRESLSLRLVIAINDGPFWQVQSADDITSILAEIESSAVKSITFYESGRRDKEVTISF